MINITDISTLQLDYIAEIYQASVIETNGQPTLIPSADLAQRLNNSQSSVNRVIERLRDAQLVQHERYIGVGLTASGEQIARALLRKQAIIECFLLEVMGFQWHEIYAEAQKLRHGVNEAVLERMFQLAQRPTKSPFGEWIDPLPGHTPTQILLTTAAVKQRYTINRVLTRQSDRLSYLSALGLQPDCEIYLIHKAPFHGPLQIQLAREYRILGYDLANLLTVKPVP